MTIDTGLPRIRTPARWEIRTEPHTAHTIHASFPPPKLSTRRGLARRAAYRDLLHASTIGSPKCPVEPPGKAVRQRQVHPARKLAPSASAWAGPRCRPDHPRTCARSSRKGRTPRPIPDRGRDADDNHFLAPVAAALLLVLVGAPYAPHGVPTTYGSMPDPTLAAFMGTLGSLHLFLGMLAIASAPLAAGICGPATLTTSRY